MTRIEEALQWLGDAVITTGEWFSRADATVGVVIGAVLAFWLQRRIRREERTSTVEDQVLSNRRMLLVEARQQLGVLYDLVVRADIAHKITGSDFANLTLSFKNAQVTYLLLSESIEEKELRDMMRDTANKLQTALITKNPNSDESQKIMNRELLHYLKNHRFLLIIGTLTYPDFIKKAMIAALTPVLRRRFYQRIESSLSTQVELTSAWNHQQVKEATSSTNALSKRIGESVRAIDIQRLQSAKSKLAPRDRKP